MCLYLYLFLVLVPRHRYRIGTDIEKYYFAPHIMQQLWLKKKKVSISPSEEEEGVD